MSQTPIFDALYEEFLAAHRVVPATATMDQTYEHPIPEHHEEETPAEDDTTEIPVVVESAPSEQEPKDVMALIDTETFSERIGREIMEHIEKYSVQIPNKPFTPALIKAEDALAANGFVGLMEEHRNNILFPDVAIMPTREEIEAGYIPREDFQAEEPEENVEEQHVFPRARGKHHKFTSKPVVAKLSDALQSVVFESSTAA